MGYLFAYNASKVFLDNRPGSLFEAMSQLDKNKIKVFALSIADAGEFGLVRLITEEPEKASKLLGGCRV